MPTGLTRRQLEILSVWGEHGSYKLTAAELRISPRTVNSALLLVRTWYRVGTTSQAFRAALVAGDLGLVTPVRLPRPITRLGTGAGRAHR